METTLNQEQTSTSARLQIGLAFFAFIMIGASDGAFGVLLPSVQLHYRIDKSVVGLFFLMGSFGYLTGAFNSGWLVQRLGYRRFLMMGAGAFGIATFLINLTPPFLLVLPCLTLIGFGISVLDAGLNAYIAGLSSSTVLLNYLHAFYGLGALFGPILASGVLAVGWPWNSTYLFLLGFSLILLTGLAILYTNSGQLRQTRQEKVEAGGNILLSTLKLRVVWIAALFLLFYVGGEVSVGNWSYSFLTQERQQLPLQAGWVVSGYWLGLTLGRLTLARLAAFWKVDDWHLIRYCLVGVIAGVGLVWFSPVPALLDFGLLLTGYSLGPIFPTTIALLPKLVTGRVLQSAIGFVAGLGSTGAAFFPWVAGNLAQWFGLWTLLPYVAALALLMLLCWLALQTYYNKNHALVEAA